MRVEFKGGASDIPMECLFGIRDPFANWKFSSMTPVTTPSCATIDCASARVKPRSNNSVDRTRVESSRKTARSSTTHILVRIDRGDRGRGRSELSESHRQQHLSCEQNAQVASLDEVPESGCPDFGEKRSILSVGTG